MTIKAATPYIMLAGDAEEAIALYQQALGAELKTLQRFGDMMPHCPEAQRNHVMHAELHVGTAVIMVSDGGAFNPMAGPGSVSIALVPDDPDEARRCFDGLAATGTVIEPLAPAPWGALFGALRDKYGVSWMFNCEVKPS